MILVGRYHAQWRVIDTDVVIPTSNKHSGGGGKSRATLLVHSKSYVAFKNGYSLMPWLYDLFKMNVKPESGAWLGTRLKM